MTAPTTMQTVDADVRVTESRARFSDLLAAEWIKMWSLRSTFWAFAVSLLAVLAVSLSTAYGDSTRYPGMDAGQQEYFRTFGAVGDSFPMGSATFMALGAGAIGAITMLSEFTTGMIRTTFTAVPARRSVMVAKVVVVTAVTTAFGALAVLCSYAGVQWILSGQDAAAGLGHPGVPQLLAASVVLAPVCALIGMAMGALIRHSVLTIIATITLLFVLPSLLNGQQRLGATILHTLVLQAWQRLTYDDATGDPFPWTTTGAWTVLAVWTVVAAAVTVFSADRRDQ
ncbi:ABC transporter permease [Streptomyces sp. NPDC090022]|uniref:ABC transporter permease n=1 Tax=Streptomyces sp. NPDC090022 TaxID=3365920 RepID=UPI0038287495